MVCSDVVTKTAGDGQTHDRDWAMETEVCCSNVYFTIQFFIYIGLVPSIYICHNKVDLYNLRQ